MTHYFCRVADEAIEGRDTIIPVGEYGARIELTTGLIAPLRAIVQLPDGRTYLIAPGGSVRFAAECGATSLTDPIGDTQAVWDVLMEFANNEVREAGGRDTLYASWSIVHWNYHNLCAFAHAMETATGHCC